MIFVTTQTMHFLVQDLECAKLLKGKRLLTSCLRHEPAFKQDDPDELDVTTKKARFVKQFNFEHLLPLRMSAEEAALAVELGFVQLEPMPSSTMFLVKLKDSSNNQTCKVVIPSSRSPVFKALWERGYTMVDGLKYGVDYLAYSQDPLRHHADFMVLVGGDELVSPGDCIALATVAGKAKKQLLIATCAGGSDQVQFTKMERQPVNVKKKKKRKRSSAGKKQEEVTDV